MSKNIVVIDYGMGNLRSVSKAIEHVSETGDKVYVTSDPELILSADRVVFPGQGAARDCMAAISNHHLNRAVLDAAHSKPFFGICMGLQVLMTLSEENGGTDLLGLIAGPVRRFPEARDGKGLRLKIPQMGWNRVKQRVHPLWQGIPDPASHLNRQIRIGRCNPADDIAVHRLTGKGAIQVHQMQPASPSRHPASGHFHRVIGKNRLIIHAPLAQADATAIFQVNRGYQQHNSAPCDNNNSLLRQHLARRLEESVYPPGLLSFVLCPLYQTPQLRKFSSRRRPSSALFSG